ncbi:MAG: hypothetical protein P4L84_09305 [Isosphaeraceae bacterium]|nr:hypothetical protein [Isosphaeraceae bacterium]
MTINEVAAFLGYPPDRIRELIDDGLALPKSRVTFKLAASTVRGVPDISDTQLG